MSSDGEDSESGDSHTSSSNSSSSSSSSSRSDNSSSSIDGEKKVVKSDNDGDKDDNSSSSSKDSEDDPLSRPEQDGDATNMTVDVGKNATKAGHPTLSKSWSVQAAHVPTFTGGKVTASSSSSSLTLTSTNGNQEQQYPHDLKYRQQHHPFLLLPVHGDVAIVDSVRGVALGSLRKGINNRNGGNQYDITGFDNNDDDDDDDDDDYDHDTITSYALSSDDRTVITCSRNNLIRQYSIHVGSTANVGNDNAKEGSTHTSGNNETGGNDNYGAGDAMDVSTVDDDNHNDRHNDQVASGSVSSSTAKSPPSPPVVSATCKLVHTWGRSNHTLPVTQLEFHMSGVFVATGSVDGTVRVWDVRGRYITHVFRPVSNANTGGGGGENSAGGGTGRYGITSLRWKSQLDQLILAIGRDDGSVAIHNLKADVPDGNNRSDKFKTGNNSSKMKKIAALNRGIHESYPPVIVIHDHVSAVTCMDWWTSPDEEDFFVTTGRDSVVNLWRVVVQNADDHDNFAKSTGKKKKSKGRRHGNLGTVVYRRIQTMPLYEQVEGMVIVSASSRQSKNELSLVTAGTKGVLRKWTAHVKQGETPNLSLALQQPYVEEFGEKRGGYMGLVVDNSSSNNVPSHPAHDHFHQVLIAVDAEHNLSFVNSQLRSDRTIVGHNDEILDLKIIPNTSSFIVATNSPQVRIFDLVDFSCHVLDGHTATALCVDTSPCGRYVVSCGKDKTLRIWNTQRGGYQCIGIGTGHTEPIGSCGLSQKVGKYEVGGKAARNGGGAFCITASLDRTIKRWNLVGPDEWPDQATDGGVDRPLDMNAATSVRGHEKDINIISVAPNDSIVASGSQDKTVKLWNATDLSLRATLKGHKRGVWDCQFSPIDRVLATSSGDKTIKLWSLSDHSCVRTFQGHISSVLRVRFLRTGLQLVSSGADGLIKVWTIRTNECEATLDAHSDKVWAMDLAYGGNDSSQGGDYGDLLISGSADSRLLVWKDTTADLEEEQRSSQADKILLDQQMANHLRHKEYEKALEIALKVEKPMHVLKVITALLESELSTKRNEGANALQCQIAKWDLERIAQVLKYCRDWNTRALNSRVAMWVLKSIVTTIPTGRLASVEATQTNHGSIPEILAGIMPYAERHFDRLDRLYGSSFLLDFLLQSMESLDPVFDDTDGANAADEFSRWQETSTPVLPPKIVDGRIQVSGMVLVGAGDDAARTDFIEGDGGGSETDEIITIGDSSDSSSSDSDNE